MEEQEPQQTGSQPMPEGLLYHYTDQKGLNGILESGSIRATHYRFLNDTQERKEAPTLVFECIEKLFPNPKPKYWDRVTPALKKAWEDIDAYFVSFTQEPGSNGDRLSQWRGYSLDHHGFSLGFNAARLKSKAEMMMDMNDKKRPSIYLLKCLYDEEKKRILSHDSVKVHWKTAVEKWEERNKNKTSLENGKSIGKELADNLEPFQENLLKFSAMFKHQGFREESEWRIVLYMHCELTNPDLIQFRDGFFGRTPFISIPLGLKDPDSPLERIVVGPAQDKEQSVARLRIDLAKLGIQGVEVVPSKIPYRNW